MKNYRVFKCLVLGVMALGSFGVAMFAHQQPQVVEEAAAWSGTQKPNVEVDYYSSCEGKTGTALKSALSSFNKPKNPSYDWGRYEAADELENDSSSILSLYTRHAIKKNSHCGSYSWTTWNREHVYPQGNFPNSDKDNHNIFACEGQINNTRGNKSFAKVGGTPVSEFGHTTECYTNSSYFEPCDAAKGEVARACMYCTIYYGYSLSQIFDSVETAIKWHAQFPVTDREIRRNNVVYGLQGNRNPFIDHPSYANSIFGANYTEPDPLQDVPSTDPAVKSVSVSPSTLTLDIAGETKTAQLTATVTVVNDAPQTVTWSSTNENVATVKDGTVTAVGVGTATIKATSTFDANKFASCAVTVRDSSQPTPVVSSVTVSPTSLNLDLNGTKTATLQASVSAVDGAPQTVTWTTSNSRVATVNNGVVTAIGTGNAIIKATSTFDSTKYGSCSVTVIDTTPGGGEEENPPVTPPDGGEGENPPVTPTGPTLVSIEVTPPTKVVYKVGEQLDLTGFKVIAHYSDNSTKDVTASVRIALDTSAEGSASIFVSYEENGVTVSSTNAINFMISNSAGDDFGCSGSIIATSALLSITSLLGAGLILIKKRRKFEDK